MTGDLLVDALQRLASEWDAEAERADDAEPLTDRDLSRMIVLARCCRGHANEVRALIDKESHA